MTDASPLRLYLWPQRLLFIGHGLDTHAHRHHAAQLCISLGEAPVRIRSHHSEAWRPGPAFFISPDVPHQVVHHQELLALLFLDPEGSDCDAISQHLCGSTARGILPALPAPPLVDALRELAVHQNNAARANNFCNALLGLSVSHTKPIDARLQRVLNWLENYLETPIRLATLARIAQASESWLVHNFTRTIGVPIRRYVLWCRLRLAIGAALDGASLTCAAHAAGFADAAHLSRTFRENFGVAPSFLFSRRNALSVTFCNAAAYPEISASPS